MVDGRLQVRRVVRRDRFRVGVGLVRIAGPARREHVRFLAPGRDVGALERREVVAVHEDVVVGDRSGELALLAPRPPEEHREVFGLERRLVPDRAAVVAGVDRRRVVVGRDHPRGREQRLHQRAPDELASGELQGLFQLRAFFFADADPLRRLQSRPVRDDQIAGPFQARAERPVARDEVRADRRDGRAGNERPEHGRSVAFVGQVAREVGHAARYAEDRRQRPAGGDFSKNLTDVEEVAEHRELAPERERGG